MSNKQKLKVMINKRLSEAAEEIFSLFEQTVADYQREIDRLRNVSKAEQMEVAAEVALQTETVGQEKHAVDVLTLENTAFSQCNGESGELQQNGNSDEQVRGRGAETDDSFEPISGAWEEDSDTDSVRIYMGSDTLMEQFACLVCKKSFPKIRGLKLHMRRVHPDDQALFLAQLDAQTPSNSQLNMDILCRPLTCTICHRRFKLESSLEAHMRAHAEENPCTCPECGASFPNQTSFISHMHQVHSTEKPFSCMVCYKGFPSLSALQTHMRIHTGERPYLCSVCGKGFTVSGHLKDHMNTHSEKKRYTCMKCEKKYKFKRSLMNHACMVVERETVSQREQRSCLDDGDDGQQRKTNDEQARNIDTDELPFGFEAKQFRCPVCKKHFPQKKELKTHMRRVHTSKKRLLTENEPHLRKDMESVLCRPFICTVCHRLFKLQASLEAHMKAHAEENPCTCPECSKSFPNQSSFISHMRQVHSTDENFKCSVCYRGFRQKSALKIHMYGHTGERPFLCSVCGKGFTKSSNLKDHMTTHTREKPFCCTKCGKKYTSKQNLTNHMETCQNTTMF